jgi:hypothetical protein
LRKRAISNAFPWGFSRAFSTLCCDSQPSGSVGFPPGG